MSDFDFYTIQEVLARNLLPVKMIPHALCTLSLIFLLFGKATLLLKILTKRDCTGVSGKTQMLYTLVFASRYLDLATNDWISSWIFSLPKICLLILSYGLALAIYFFYYPTYQSHYDKFRIEHVILPSIILSLLSNYGIQINAIFWAFSVYLEAMAFIPQLYFCSKAKKVEPLIYFYVFSMTLYKSFQVINEIFNHFYVSSEFDRITLAAGIVQLMLYFDIFNFEEEVVHDKDDAESESDVPIVFVHPKEAEAIRSEAESAAIIAEDNRTMISTDEVILLPSKLSVQDENEATAIPTITEVEENKNQVDLPTPEVTIPKTDVKEV